MKLHELAKDKFIAQISSIFLVIGSGILFTAVSWPLLVIGQFLTSCGTAFTGMQFYTVIASHSILCNISVLEMRKFYSRVLSLNDILWRDGIAR